MAQKRQKQTKRGPPRVVRRGSADVAETSPRQRVISGLWATLKWGGLSLVALVALLILINVFDQDVRPEIAAFSDFSSEQVPPEQNAFLAVTGHTAAASDDPQRKGVEIVAMYEQRVATAKHYDPTIHEIPAVVLGPKQLKFIGETSKLCTSTTQRCLIEYRRKARLIEQMWRDNQILVNRYHRLYDYPHYRETTAESIYILFSAGDIQTNALVRAHIGLQAIAGNRQQALEALRRDTRYQRLVLREGRILITKMIATARIKRNLTLLSEIIATAPLAAAEVRTAREILTPFDAAEMDMGRAFRSEFNFIRNTLETSPDWGPLDAESAEQPWWTDLANVFFKRNASINLTYERSLVLVKLAELPPEKLASELESGRVEASLAGEGLSWHSVYNPLGKTLAAVVPVETMTRYIARVRNMDALMRLVTLQLAARERDLSDRQLPSFLTQSDRTLANPYTAEPARWDGESGSIYFLCLREKDDSELMGHRVEVVVRPEGN